MALEPEDVAMISDIGCSGMLDTFFNTHAFHGLHGRALTYAAGIKLARPRLKVLVTMGDGGLGIGGAHLLAACRRNLDITLLVLNNFNFGMTGGQFSCTTPNDADVNSGFLNTIERPMDVCSVACAAGAPFVMRSSAYGRDLHELLVEALSFEGFSLVDIWGICPGRYGRRNSLKPSEMETAMGESPPFRGPVPENLRQEFSVLYRQKAGKGSAEPDWRGIEKTFSPPVDARREVLLLGSAGGGVIAAGTVLAHGAVLAGMHVTQKNDHNITVMRGPSISELIISPHPIDYTGVERPDAILALSREGVARRQGIFKNMKKEGVVIAAKGVDIPPAKGRILHVDFKAHGIKKRDMAFTALSLLAMKGEPITYHMIEKALRRMYQGKRLKSFLDLLKSASNIRTS